MEQTGLGPDKMPGLKTKAGFVRRRLAGIFATKARSRTR